MDDLDFFGIRMTGIYQIIELIRHNICQCIIYYCLFRAVF